MSCAHSDASCSKRQYQVHPQHARKENLYMLILSVFVIMFLLLEHFRLCGIFVLFDVLPFSLYVHRGGRRGRDRIVVGFTTTCAISVYYH